MGCSRKSLKELKGINAGTKFCDRVFGMSNSPVKNDMGLFSVYQQT